MNYLAPPLSLLSEYALPGALGIALITLCVYNFRPWRQQYRQWRAGQANASRVVIRGEVRPDDQPTDDDAQQHNQVEAVAVSMGAGLTAGLAFLTAGNGSLQLVTLLLAAGAWAVTMWRKIRNVEPPPGHESEFPNVEMPKEALVGMGFGALLSFAFLLYVVFVIF